MQTINFAQRLMAAFDRNKMVNLNLFRDSCHETNKQYTYQHIYINSTIYLLNAKSLYGVKVCTRVQLKCGLEEEYEGKDNVKHSSETKPYKHERKE